MRRRGLPCSSLCLMVKTIRGQGASMPVLHLATAFERVSHPVVWKWATYFNFIRRTLRVLCGYFEHQRKIQFERCAAEPFQTITAILPGSIWSCLLLRIVLRDALSAVTKDVPAWDDITPWPNR